MQIVIDISEDVYTRLFDNGIQDNEIATDDICEMARALRLGAPLPKGHGRLIDADVLKGELDTITEWNGIEKMEQNDYVKKSLIYNYLIMKEKHSIFFKWFYRKIWNELYELMSHKQIRSKHEPTKD